MPYSHFAMHFKRSKYDSQLQSKLPLSHFKKSVFIFFIFFTSSNSLNGFGEGGLGVIPKGHWNEKFSPVLSRSTKMRTYLPTYLVSMTMTHWRTHSLSLTLVILPFVSLLTESQFSHLQTQSLSHSLTQSLSLSLFLSLSISLSPLSLSYPTAWVLVLR